MSTSNNRGRRWFAAANGWREAQRRFGYKVLARGGVHGLDDDVWWEDLPDHAEYYRKDRRAIAIVGHNYDGSGWAHRGTEAIAQLAAKHGLVVHLAPAGKAASWYYPGSTTPLVITRPGVVVVWPTDAQMAATARAHAEEEAGQLRIEALQKERRLLRQQRMGDQP